MKTYRPFELRKSTSFVATIALAVVFASTPYVSAQQPGNGELRGQETVEVWSKELNKWVSPIEFWRAFAALNGGLTWGERDTYPQFSKVKERDLMIIQLASGACLMEFFHTRWRRANDVRRWDTRFNDVAGCPHVFD